MIRSVKTLDASGAWLIHSDGSAFPNPGTMGLGATFLGPDGAQYQLSVTAQGLGCNNEAEARAVMAALQHASVLGVRKLRLYSDSRVVVDQINGIETRKIARLEQVFENIRLLLASFEQTVVVWIPGHRNTQADALARASAGLPPRPAAKASKKKQRRAMTTIAPVDTCIPRSD